MKHHELLWGSALVAFIAWVFLAPNPSVRISRVCRPISWASSGIVSLTALTAPKYETDAQEGGNRVVYGCEYSIWRLFYQKDYDAYLAAQRRRLLGPRKDPLPHCSSAAPAGANGPGGHAQATSCGAPTAAGMPHAGGGKS
ncbi:MAG: hypothetical protein ACP5P4_12850 [Steroidobacteraceae bacterium]